MLDLVARLVNALLDLGIADRDIRLRLVLNNDHVRATRIPELVAECEGAVSANELRRQRNDVVHRGRLLAAGSPADGCYDFCDRRRARGQDGRTVRERRERTTGWSGPV